MAEQQSRVPVWARDDLGGAPPEQEAIVAAAVAIADAEGLDAVSIRRVASPQRPRHGLYTYIERKEDLLDLMADEVAAETLVPGELPDWRGGNPGHRPPRTADDAAPPLAGRPRHPAFRARPGRPEHAAPQ